MPQHNLIGVYRARSDAENARTKLLGIGIAAGDIRLSEPWTAPAAVATPPAEPNFWNRLWGDIPARDRERYRGEIQQHRTVLSVRVANEKQQEQALAIMDAFNPVDIAEDAALAPGAEPASAETEEVIPVVHEELAVGRKVIERRVRIRAYVVERPVEETVMLRDERVEIERRPAGAATAAALPAERDIEVIERHEEPVVEKRGVVKEEVVVRRDVSERPETVRGRVGETRVEIDRDPPAKPAKPVKTGA